MHTRIAIICDRIVEAGWLVAVLVIPLHFNPYDLRIFEADKTSLLRSISLIMLLSWLTARIALGDWQVSWRSLLSVLRSTPPVLQTTLLFLTVYLVATATSEVPRASIFGSYSRQQGFYTTVAYLILFGLISSGLRSPIQLDRLIDTLLLASWPVVLFAILQQIGLSPVSWETEDPSRAFSTLGNPIFLGAYLVMVIPLTALRGSQAMSRLRQSPRPRAALFYMAFIALLLAAQLIALTLTGSRGPWLAFVGAVLLATLLWAAIRRKRRLALILLIVPLVLAVAVPILITQPHVLESIDGLPIQNWLGSTRLTAFGTIQSRLLIWEGVIDLARSDPGKLLIGYGPEVIQEVLMPHLSPMFSHFEFANRQPDRAHNLIYDIMVTTGVAGLITYLALFSSLLVLGLGSLGLVPGHLAKIGFATALVLGSLLGLLVPGLVLGTWNMSGLGLAIGLIAGLAFYLLIVTIRAQPGIPSNNALAAPSASSGGFLLCIPLLTGLMTHFLETNLGGIAITTTELTFWVYAGSLVAVTHRPVLFTTWDTPASQQAGPPGIMVHTWNAWGTLTGLMLVTLAFGVAPTQPFDPTMRHFSPVWFLGGTWLLCLFYFLTSRDPLNQAIVPSPPISPPSRARQQMWNDAIRHFAIWSLGSLALFMGFRAAVLWASGDAISMLYGYWLLLFGGWGVIAVFLGEPSSASPGRSHLQGKTLSQVSKTTSQKAYSGAGNWIVILSVLLGLLAAVIIVWTNISLIKADIYAQAASSYAGRQRWEESFLLFSRVMELAPDEPGYLTQIAKAYASRAMSADPGQKATWFSRAAATLRQARALNPRHPDHAFNLAHLYLAWAQVTPDRVQQTTLLDEAIVAYRVTAEIMPRSPQVYNEWALTYQLKGDYAQALRLYQRSLNLDPGLGQTYLLLGRYYMSSGHIGDAIDSLEQARRLDAKSMDVYMALSEVYLIEGLLEKALDAAQRAVEVAPENYLSHYRLARVYEHLGKPEAALAEAQIAFNYAPADAQPGLRQFFLELKARNP